MRPRHAPDRDTLSGKRTAAATLAAATHGPRVVASRDPTMRLVNRLGLTVLVPVLLLVLGELLPIPGFPMADEAREGPFHLTHGTGSVFMLGVAPIVTAYMLVELVALLSPGLWRLRHGNPAGRRKLDRAVGVVAVLLMIVQVTGMVLALREIDGGSSISIPIVAASLIGGVCVQYVAARFVSEQGILNGYVAVVGATHLRAVVEDVVTRFGALQGRPDARAAAACAVGLAVMVLATWATLRRVGPEGAPVTADAEAGAAYRDAGQLVVRPWIPIPSSSFWPYGAALALLGMPATIAAFVPGFAPVARALAGDAFLVVQIALTGSLVVLAAALLHRPREMAELAGRLLPANEPKLRAETHAALWRTMAPSLLFFLAIILASRAAGIAATSVVILTVTALGLAESVRTLRARPGLVPVWEERRASAVPVLRAALAERGISSEARGLTILSFFQLFVPYAPAELLVSAADAPRATQILRHLLVGDEEPAPAPGPVVRVDVPGHAWPLRSRTAALRAAALAGGVALAVVALPQRHAAHAAGAGTRAKLEVVRVDDAIDPFAGVSESAIPEGAATSLFLEQAPVGKDRALATHFARTVLREGETRAAAVARIRPWLETLKVAPGERFGFQDIVETDDTTKKAAVVGVRTFLLTGESAIDTDDIADARVMTDPGRPEPNVYVAVTLTPRGADRFAAMTGDWLNRRAAILVDGRVDSAPIIKAVISGGRLSITIGRHGDSDPLADAEQLARALSGQ